MKKLFIIIITFCLSTSIFANIDITVGDTRFVFEDYTGVVGIYTKNSEGSFTSLLDSKTFTQIPTFYVKYNSAIYPVSTEGGFKIVSTFRDNRATVVATLKNRVEVTLNFDIFPANVGENANSVKISSSIVNLSNSTKTVALKAIFDTWLGEHSLVHLVTSENDSITSEYEFDDKSVDKWIDSQNNSAAVRFYIPEEQSDYIDSVVIANKSLLSQPRWGFIVYPDREFHSLNSYNNSAFSVTWKDVKISDIPFNDIEFYVFTGEKEVSVPRTWPPNIPVIEVTQTLDVSAVSQEDMQKILEILATIEELRKDNAYLNEDEILKLHAEVDEILLNSGR